MRRRKFFPFSRHFFFSSRRRKKNNVSAVMLREKKRTKDREGKIQLNFRVRRLTLSKKIVLVFFICRVSSPSNDKSLSNSDSAAYSNTHTHFIIMMKTHYCLSSSMLLSNSDRGAGGALVRFPLDEVERRRRRRGAVFRRRRRRRRLPPATDADCRRRRRR